LFTNNSCNPSAKTIQAVIDCITALNTEIATKMAIIADLQATIAALPENVINSLIDEVNSLVGMDMLDEKDAKKLLEELDDALEGVEEGNRSM